jgi:RNA polymerase sigma-70 factor, ECF subfamily
VRQYHKKVMGHCLSMLSNYRDAEEATQDIFVKAYQSLSKFKRDSSFSTWIYRIATNYCLDILRKRNRRKNVSLDSLVEDEGDRVQKLFSVPPNADSVLENRELVEKILASIPEDYRTILTLREADGLEYQEIAAVLNISLDAVKGRLARTRRYLQEHLQHFLGEKGVYIKEGESHP